MISSNSNANSPGADQGPVRPAQSSRHSLGKGVLVGLGAALAVAVVVGIARHRHAPPRLTVADYESAVERWKRNGPASYDLDLELGGKRPGNVHVEVRAGQVVHITRDGVEPSQKRTWDYWSVPGQLETIGEELEMAAQPARSFGAAGASEVVIWAEFDPRYGYARKYDRVVLGADIEVHWRVTRFEVVGDK
jgi:hypothetical protein